ncbi:hypothetical protein MUP95_03825 [bacterium]|jgi:hypothetical protein|nr:hypothetical protein [bacterium]
MKEGKDINREEGNFFLQNEQSKIAVFHNESLCIWSIQSGKNILTLLIKMITF